MDFQLPLKVSRDANDNIDSDTVHDCSCPIADMLAVHSFISGDVDLTILYLLQYQAAEWQAEEWHLEIICFYVYRSHQYVQKQTRFPTLPMVSFGLFSRASDFSEYVDSESLRVGSG